MQRLSFTLTNETGLHARPASMLVKKANSFQADIQIRNLTTNSTAVDAKSILLVLTLGGEQGHQIQIDIQGKDEAQAVQELGALIEGGFSMEGEGEPS